MALVWKYLEIGIFISVSAHRKDAVVNGQIHVFSTVHVLKSTSRQHKAIWCPGTVQYFVYADY